MIFLHHFDSVDTSGLQVGLHTRVVFRIDIGGTIRFDISSVSVFLFLNSTSMGCRAWYAGELTSYLAFTMKIPWVF